MFAALCVPYPGYYRAASESDTRCMLPPGLNVPEGSSGFPRRTSHGDLMLVTTLGACNRNLVGSFFIHLPVEILEELEVR